MSEPHEDVPVEISFSLRDMVFDTLRNSIVFGTVLGIMAWMHLANTQ